MIVLPSLRPAIAIILLLLTSSVSSLAQTYDSTFFGPVAGLHVAVAESSARMWGEIGLTRMWYRPTHSGPELHALSASLMVSPGDTPLMAVTASGVCQVLLFGAGWTAGAYFDQYHIEARLIPELYLGSDRFLIGVGPHIVLMRSKFMSISELAFFIRWNFPTWSTPRERTR